MQNNTSSKIKPARGKLGILTPGLGAVATTMFAGVEAVKLGTAKPIGSLTQMGNLRLGKRSQNRLVDIKSFLPLAGLDQVVFGGWDIFTDNAYESAKNARVLEPTQLEALRPQLEKIKPMSAVFDPEYIKRITGPNVKKGKNKMDLADQLRADIRKFVRDNDLTRVVMVWCASTESYITLGDVHSTLDKFEAGLRNSDPGIAPSMIYTYAALMENVPYANGSPNQSVELPALQELAKKRNVPIAGSDFKTGQTLMKTVLAPGLKARALGLAGWYSTNILGNRDGEVLEDPGSFKSKELTKLSVLDQILQPEVNPDLYGDYHHIVKINYYPPRGDNKEGWDNIDIFGWLGYPMQIKVNFLCRDSILAAPIVLDLALFMDLAGRAGLKGIQEWLSFYFKSPQCRPDLKPEHDLFVQHMKLKNTLR
ncbi:MAG: inositol-3-phosphate synthase, partial [Deltaproteobacteria bacterium]|nr:inositol-3-phosphate synthase [Deltaproteobacteria bacterium]